MKILYDHQAFSMQDFGGVSKIFAELSIHLRHYPGVVMKYPKMFSNNDYIYNDTYIGASSFFKKKKFKGKGTILGYLKKVNGSNSRSAIEKGDFDIFHPTYYDPYYLSYQIKKPVVVTCYDLIHEKYMTSDTETLAWKKKTLASATKIIAISANTKNDLIEYYTIPKDRVEVVHLGSSFPVQNPGKTEYKGPPFFLYVGNREGYKNFGFFLESISPLLLKHQDLHLYCAGGQPFSKSELSFFKEMGVNEKVKHFSGSHESLIELYSSAISLCYPSLYEGFGIPLLEAMACRCPIVSSNQSSLPEVAGNAANYFDPKDRESILNAAENILNDTGLRKDLSLKGVERLKNFSWEKMAKQTFDIYKSIL